jgi:hypothetical protein
VLELLEGSISYAQSGCDSTIQFIQLGSATNIQTILNSRLNPLAYDSASQTIAFIHRNDVSIFGGTSGQLRYDLSTDSGSSWNLNLGLLNPVTYATNPGRYPQASLWNSGNSPDPNEPYLVYHAATTNGFVYNGYVSGSRQLDNSPNTEIVNQAGVTTETYIPGGMCSGEPGVYWTVDAKYDYSSATYSGFRIFKGEWNGTDVTWTLNQELNPDFNLSFNGKPQVADWNITFDQGGLNGWMICLTHLNGGASQFQYHPVFYNTTDGGLTWNGPIQLELDQFPEVASILTPGNFASTAYQVDMVIDMNGQPHALLDIGSGDGTDYEIDPTSLFLFDITFDGVVWKATNISKLESHRGLPGSYFRCMA